MAKISVIIPCYNVYNYLDDCFDSLTSQTIGIDNLEIIFINDASPDNTYDKLLEIEAKCPESVMVINLEHNMRQGGARNVGLSYATGEYVFFLDSDDFIAKDFFEELYNIAKDYDTDIIQFPFAHIVLENSKMTVLSYSHFSKIDGFFLVDTVEKRKRFLGDEILNYSSQSKFYKRTFLLENSARFIEGKVYEEPSFVYPLLLKGVRFYGYKEPKYFYRMNNPNSTLHSITHGKGKLYDHPYVQMSIFLALLEDIQLYETYKAEIDYYFVYTYFIETVYFSQVSNLFLGYDMLCVLKNTVLQYVPNYKTNVYLNRCTDAEKSILSLVDMDLSENEWEKIKEVFTTLQMS